MMITRCFTIGGATIVFGMSGAFRLRTITGSTGPTELQRLVEGGDAFRFFDLEIFVTLGVPRQGTRREAEGAVRQEVQMRPVVGPDVAVLMAEVVNMTGTLTEAQVFLGGALAPLRVARSFVIVALIPARIAEELVVALVLFEVEILETEARAEGVTASTIETEFRTAVLLPLGALGAGLTDWNAQTTGEGFVGLERTGTR